MDGLLPAHRQESSAIAGGFGGLHPHRGKPSGKRAAQSTHSPGRPICEACHCAFPCRRAHGSFPAEENLMQRLVDAESSKLTSSDAVAVKKWWRAVLVIYASVT